MSWIQWLALGRTDAATMEHISTAPDDYDSVPPVHAHSEGNSDGQRNRF